MDWKVFGLAVVQLLVLMMFVTADLEVFKAIWAWITKKKLSEGAIKFWNFAIALIFCRAFDYGAMVRILGVDTVGLGEFAFWTDATATAAVIYMGADYLFSWYWKIKAKADAITAGAPPSAP